MFIISHDFGFGDVTPTTIKILIKVFHSMLKSPGKEISHSHEIASFWSAGWLVHIEPETYTF